jgi:hypothetical protein
MSENRQRSDIFSDNVPAAPEVSPSWLHYWSVFVGALSGIEACHVIYSPRIGEFCTLTSLNVLILTQMVPRILLFCIGKCQHNY